MKLKVCEGDDCLETFLIPVRKGNARKYCVECRRKKGNLAKYKCRQAKPELYREISKRSKRSPKGRKGLIKRKNKNMNPDDYADRLASKIENREDYLEEIKSNLYEYI